MLLYRAILYDKGGSFQKLMGKLGDKLKMLEPPDRISRRIIPLDGENRFNPR